MYPDTWHSGLRALTAAEKALGHIKMKSDNVSAPGCWGRPGGRVSVPEVVCRPGPLVYLCCIRGVCPGDAARCLASMRHSPLGFPPADPHGRSVCHVLLEIIKGLAACSRGGRVGWLPALLLLTNRSFRDIVISLSQPISLSMEQREYVCVVNS